MYQINWGDLTPALFLAEYWQKKPLLIKNAFTQFTDPISADELAGLAMEEDVQSRIIAKNNNGDVSHWHVEHGPFEDYSAYGESDWTLLVQAANNWSEDTHQLLKPFNFIPNWRLDDVMVSFSTPNGGVGPHLDQYDVFILQGEGKRHWQVGAPDASLETLIPHPDLKQVSVFTPIIDVVTEAGDLLYIPPNHPHNGIAITNALNFSIGFQSPSSQELLSGFADTLLDKNIGLTRFNDQNRALTTSPEVLSEKDVEQLKLFMLEQINSKNNLKQFMGCQLTLCQHALELLPPEEELTVEDVQAILLNEDIEITPVLGIKSLIMEGDTEHLYVCGEAFDVDADSADFAQKLACKEPLTTQEIKSSFLGLKNLKLLTSLLNKGYWYIS